MSTTSEGSRTSTPSNTDSSSLRIGALRYPTPNRNVDVGTYRAKEFRKWLWETGPAFASDDNLDVFVAVRHPTLTAEATRLHRYSSPETLCAFLETVKLASPNSHVLIIAAAVEPPNDSNRGASRASRDAGSRRGRKDLVNPCIDVRTLARVISLYEMHPMVIHSLRKRGILEKQHVYRQAATPKGKGPASAAKTASLDISAYLPMCWVEKKDERQSWTAHTANFGTSIYTTMQPLSQGSATLYLCLPQEWTDSVFESWQARFEKTTSEYTPLPLDALTLLENGIESMNGSLHYQEVMGMIHTDLPMANLIEGSIDNQIPVVEDIRKHLDLLRAYNTDIQLFAVIVENIEETLKEQLDEGCAAGNEQHKQCRNWFRNMNSNLFMCKSRCQFLLSRALDMQRHMVDVASVKNSIALNRNTTHTSRLADANNEASKEVAELARLTREDSILLKFFGEIAVVFLPITAVSTFFSMGFFAINPTSNSILPFSSLKYIWIFALVTLAVSVAVYALWLHRSRDIKRSRSDRDGAERQQTEQATQAYAEAREALARMETHVASLRAEAEAAIEKWRAWIAEKEKREQVTGLVMQVTSSGDVLSNGDVNGDGLAAAAEEDPLAIISAAVNAVNGGAGTGDGTIEDVDGLENKAMELVLKATEAQAELDRMRQLLSVSGER